MLEGYGRDDGHHRAGTLVRPHRQAERVTAHQFALALFRGHALPTGHARILNAGAPIDAPL